jgi:putative transposase
MARVVVPGYPHHVTQRGNRRQKTFFCWEDYQLYLQLMAEFTHGSATQVWAYCLMPNHVHLVMVPTREDGLRSSLGEAHRRYTRHINFRNEWRGHLWQERFHSFPMDEHYLLAAVRYIELNPVKAKLCFSPGEWEWSSACAHFDGKDDMLVKVKPMLERVADWQSFLSIDNSRNEQLLAQHTRTGRPLGRVPFINQLEEETGRVLAPGRAGRKKKKLT